jgi:hypothetical protein
LVQRETLPDHRPRSGDVRSVLVEYKQKSDRRFLVADYKIPNDPDVGHRRGGYTSVYGTGLLVLRIFVNTE